MSELRDDRLPKPVIMPLGDSALLVRFGDRLDDSANRAALSLFARLQEDPIHGVLEVVPSLVSVLLRYDFEAIAPTRLGGEITLRIGQRALADRPKLQVVHVRFDGPDLSDVATELGLSIPDFILEHNARPLRVLTTGFAPGFIYCGFHPAELVVPRRTSVRANVPAGSVLFAAGQTAIAATEIPTGWHVIGSTPFRNFLPENDPPTLVHAGDEIRFEEVL